jgi:hypothetical protein
MRRSRRELGAGTVEDIGEQRVPTLVAVVGALPDMGRDGI